MTLPPWRDWKSWSAIIAFFGTLLGIVVALPKAGATVEPFYYVSSGYLKEATQPILAASYENKIEIIEGKQATYQTQIDAANDRLRLNPDDPVIRAARSSAQKLYDAAEFQKDEAYRQLRIARGLAP